MLEASLFKIAFEMPHFILKYLHLGKNSFYLLDVTDTVQSEYFFRVCLLEKTIRDNVNNIN